MRSAFSLRAGGKPSDVYYILNPVHQRFLEIDASFSGFVSAVTTPRVLTSFGHLCTLVARGEDAPMDQVELERATVAFVGQLLEHGLIERVTGGAPGTLSPHEAGR